MTLARVESLWAAYARDRRPNNIGASVAGAVLGELDDEVQDVVGSYMGQPIAAGPARVARLGLALSEIVRCLPSIEPVATQEYFARVAELARATLATIAEREP